jgi:COP9 signalosome complex subunit 2
MKATDPEAAIEEFLGVPALEEEKGDWGFKGLKQAIKLEFKMGQYDKVCSSTKFVSFLIFLGC